MIASAEMASALYTGMKKYYRRYSRQKVNSIPLGCNTSGAVISACYPLRSWDKKKMGAERPLALSISSATYTLNWLITG